MRKVIEQAVVTLDGKVSTPQDWLPTRWAGDFEQLSKDLLFSVDALLYGQSVTRTTPRCGRPWRRRSVTTRPG
jgi:hypothetical protein